MFGHTRKRSSKAGLPPGELLHVGDYFAEPVRISLIAYDENSFIQKNDIPIGSCFDPIYDDKIRWIHIEGIHQADIMETLQEKLQLHPLLLEDVMTTRQRAKVDDYKDYLFIVLSLLRYDSITNKIEDEQVSLILGKNYLISFQEKRSDIFNSLEERLRHGKGLIRKGKADFLAYAIIDTIVDHYFVLLEKVGLRIEELEDELSGMATHKSLSSIHHIRREVVLLRNSVWPLREVISRLQRDEDSTLLTATTKFYLKDVYDHTIQVMDTVDTFRELSRGLLDVNISNMSYRMNEVIKILTVVSTIFVPLTFITSIYGMNFVHMPELKWKYGYPLTWGVMIIVALFMIRYFRRKKWF